MRWIVGVGPSQAGVLFVAVCFGALGGCEDTPPEPVHLAEEQAAPEQTSPEVPEETPPDPSEAPNVERPSETAPEATETVEEADGELSENAPALPTKMGRRISNQLRQLFGARVALPHIEHETSESSTTQVFGLLSFSPFEACVNRHENRAEGRRECRDDGEECVQYAALLAEFGRPRTDTPEGHGGPLTIAFPKVVAYETLTCADGMEVKRAELIDIDQDGEKELVLEVVESQERDFFRGGGTFEVHQRRLRVLRMDGSEQLDLPLSQWGGDVEEAPPMQIARRARFEQAGTRIRVESVEYESAGDCPYDEAFFESDYAETDEGDGLCEGELETRALQYDRALDRWVDAPTVSLATPPTDESGSDPSDAEESGTSESDTATPSTMTTGAAPQP